MPSGFHITLLTALLFILLPGYSLAKTIPAYDNGDQLPLEDGMLADKLVRQLFLNLDRGLTDSATRPKLAIAPIDPGTTGLGPAFAARLEASLTNALVTQNPGRFRIASRADLGELVEEIGNFDSNDGQSEVQRLTRLFREAGGDYLLVIQFTQGRAGSLRLYLRAVSVVNGHIPAVASLDNIAWQQQTTDTGTLLRSPESAAHAAARHLITAMPDLDTLALSALHYGNSGFQGDFGTWWQSILTAALADTWRDNHRGTNRQLAFRRYHPKDFLPRPGHRPIKTNKTENGITWKEPADRHPLELPQRQKDGLFHLSGNYWDLGTEIEIQLEMRNRSGHLASWRGRINRRDIVVTIAPKNLSLAAPRRQDGLGPVNLHITSNHGDNPVLRIGDRFAMNITVDRPAWLHCYYQQADSTIMQIYPTRHDKNNHIKTGQHISIPDRGAGYAFQVTPPAGPELVKCFATDRQVHQQLPDSLRAQDFTALPVQHINDVAMIWRQLRNTHLSESSMAITVLP